MTEVSFDLNDYLSGSEKLEIAREVFKNLCINKFKTDAERIFSNAAYTAVAEMVDQQMDGKLDEIIRDKTISVINGLSSHSVFKPADAWDLKSSQGFEILQQAIIDSSPLIKSRVEEVISQLDKGYMIARLEELMYDVVENRLIGNKPE